MRELREEDPEAFINYMRLPMELYHGTGHCLISVGSHSGESGHCRDRFGRFLPCERYKSDQYRIENGIIGTNSAGNG